MSPPLEPTPYRVGRARVARPLSWLLPRPLHGPTLEAHRAPLEGSEVASPEGRAQTGVGALREMPVPGALRVPVLGVIRVLLQGAVTGPPDVLVVVVGY